MGQAKIKNDGHVYKSSISQFKRLVVGKSRLYFSFFVVSAVVNGAAIVALGPLLSNTMNTIATSGASDTSDIGQSCLYIVYTGVGLAFASYCMAFFAGYSAVLISKHASAMCVKSAIELDSGYYDTKLSASEVMHTITSQTMQLETFLCSSLPQLLNGVAKTLAAIGICFFFSWNVTLVVLSVTPVLVGAMVCSSMMGKRNSILCSTQTQRMLNKASIFFSNIRTVVSFHAWEETYKSVLDAIGQIKGSRYMELIGELGQGLVMTGNFGMVTLGLWYSALAINRGTNSQFEVLSVISTLALLVEGFMYIVVALPSVPLALAAVQEITDIIDARPSIQEPSVNECKKLDKAKARGRVEFTHVEFAYPSQPSRYY